MSIGILLFLYFCVKHRFHPRAQPVRGCSLSNLRGKPWSQVSCLLPPMIVMFSGYLYQRGYFFINSTSIKMFCVSVFPPRCLGVGNGFVGGLCMYSRYVYFSCTLRWCDIDLALNIWSPF